MVEGESASFFLKTLSNSMKNNTRVEITICAMQRAVAQLEEQVSTQKTLLAFPKNHAKLQRSSMELQMARRLIDQGSQAWLPAFLSRGALERLLSCGIWDTHGSQAQSLALSPSRVRSALKELRH